jgi:hypothetical protein
MNDNNGILAHALPMRIEIPLSVAVAGYGSADSIGFTSLSMR